MRHQKKNVYDDRINPATRMRIVCNGILGTITQVGLRPNGIRHTDVIWDTGQFSCLTDNQLVHECQLVENEEDSRILDRVPETKGTHSF